MRVFNLAEELEKERKKNKELEERRKKDNCLISGLSRENKEKQDIIIELIKRIDKATKYIEKHQEKQIAYNYEYYLEETEIQDLLDILKGVDNND